MIGGHLQKFICDYQWLNNGILQLPELTSPLHNLMELMYIQASRRTKRAFYRVNLAEVGWVDA